MNLQKSIELLRRDAAAIISKQHLLYFPIAVGTVDGDIVTDVDGNRYIDFVSSASSLKLGGSHPITVKAVMQQLEKCILFIADEVQQRRFRSGRWFSIEHYGVIPDGIVLGKSAGGGFPLDAFMARQEIMRSLPVSVCASTIAGFHLACAAGMAQFAYMCSARFWKIPDKNSHLMANFAEKLLSRKKETGVACIWDEETGSDDPFIAYQIAFFCEIELLLLTVARNVLRFQPPLTISREHLVRGFELLEQAIDDVISGYQSEDMFRFYPDWYPESHLA